MWHPLAHKVIHSNYEPSILRLGFVVGSWLPPFRFASRLTEINLAWRGSAKGWVWHPLANKDWLAAALGCFGLLWLVLGYF